MQASEVMPEFGIVAFHRVSLGLVSHSVIRCTMIVHIGVSRQTITVIVLRGWTLVNHVLEYFKGTLRHDGMSDNAPCGTIHGGDDIHFVFFEPTNVNNSSSSVTSDAAGRGKGWDNCWGAVFSQLATV